MLAYRDDDQGWNGNSSEDLTPEPIQAQSFNKTYILNQTSAPETKFWIAAEAPSFARCQALRTCSTACASVAVDSQQEIRA